MCTFADFVETFNRRRRIKFSDTLDRSGTMPVQVYLERFFCKRFVNKRKKLFRSSCIYVLGNDEFSAYGCDYVWTNVARSLSDVHAISLFYDPDDQNDWFEAKPHDDINCPSFSIFSAVMIDGTFKTTLVLLLYRNISAHH